MLLHNIDREVLFWRSLPSVYRRLRVRDSWYTNRDSPSISCRLQCTSLVEFPLIIRGSQWTKSSEGVLDVYICEQVWDQYLDLTQKCSLGRRSFLTIDALLPCIKKTLEATSKLAVQLVPPTKLTR